ncbi:c-type cytochrome [Corallococcus macrosporus]|uniref:C-type cytochrome n=1 Tax=Corallococcus macrosporus TaxID=35 RepID=A0ABS3DAF1_9BACT|nr:c-type cytochrome [Corallococcus macrosporus]MBN8228015.1 c-type cytochrome [Corallococcus macrosporus]
MRAPLLSAFLLLAPIASAENRGEVLFNQACSRCHVAQAPSKPQPTSGLVAASRGSGPNLGELMPRRTYEQVRKWIQGPQRLKPDTGCDTRMLAPSDLDALMSFLATVSQPPEPPREQRLRQELEQQLAERRARQPRSGVKETR